MKARLIKMTPSWVPTTKILASNPPKKSDYMADGKLYPPVPVRRGWWVFLNRLRIGFVYDTEWGYRAAGPGGVWAGCWYSDRTMCRDAYIADHIKTKERTHG